MKLYKSPKGKILALSAITLGIFAVAGLALASTTEDLQPASTQVIDDDLQVLGTARAYSIRIGAQGYGGVTFFNGTIINDTTDEDSGEEQPVTFGDDVRIDGELFRTEVGGDNPIKLSDTIRPQTTATYDLGSSSNQFRNGYFSGTITTSALSGTGIVDSTNIADGTIASADIANGTITGSDISSSANLSIATGTFSGDITAHGDINQDAADHGAAKAIFTILEDYSCSSVWTYDDSAVTCTQNGSTTGETSVTLNFNVRNRYTQVSVMNPDPHIVTYNTYAANTNRLTVHVHDHNGTNDTAVVTVTIF